jgi:hypothetical protein
MELVVTRQDLKREFKHKVVEEFIRSEGLLNSNYQRIAKENLEDIEADSIFGIKQRIKSYYYSNTSSIEGFLKVSVFMILYLLIFL